MSTVQADPAGPAVRYESYVNERLTNARTRIRLLDLAVVGLIFIGVTLAYALMMALVDKVFELPSLARRAAFGLYACFALGCAAFAVLRVIMQRVNPYYAALQVEHGLPDVKNSVVNWLDLRDRELPPAIKSAVSQRAARELSRADIDQLLGTKRTGWLAAVAGGLFLAVVILFFLSPPQFLSLMKRSFAPFTESTIATRTQLALVQPEAGDLTVSVGRAVTFVAEVYGRVPEGGRDDSVRLRYRYQPTDPYIERPLEQVESTRQWGTVLPATDVRNGFWYVIAAGDAQTPEYRVQVRSTPLVTEYAVTYRYREYLHRPDGTSHDPNLEGLRGTKVKLLARANRPVRDGQLKFVPSAQPAAGEKLKEVLETAQRVAEDSHAMLFDLVLLEDGVYQIWFTTQDGESNTDPVSHTVHVKKDNAPRVVLTKPGQDVQLPANGTLPLAGESRDDFGLTRMTLKMLVEGQEQSKPYRPGKSFKFHNGNFPLKLEYKDVLELEKIKQPTGQPLQPGMNVEYWLEAADNHDFNEPNIGTSERFKITITQPEKDQNKQQQKRDQAKNEQQQHEQQQDQQLENEDKNQQQQGNQNKNDQKQDQPNQDEQQSDKKDGTDTGQSKEEKDLNDQKEKLENAIKDQENQDQKNDNKNSQGSDENQKDAKDQKGDGSGNPKDSKDQKGDGNDQKGDNSKDPKDAKDQKGDGSGNPKDSKDQKGDGSKDPKDAKDQKGDGAGDPKDSKDQKGDGSDQKGDNSKDPKDVKDQKGDGSGNPKDSKDQKGDGSENPKDAKNQKGDGSKAPKDTKDQKGDGSADPKDAKNQKNDNSKDPKDAKDSKSDSTGDPKNAKDQKGDGSKDPKDAKDSKSDGTGDPKNAKNQKGDGSKDPKDTKDQKGDGSGNPKDSKDQKGDGSKDPKDAKDQKSDPKAAKDAKDQKDDASNASKDPKDQKGDGTKDPKNVKDQKGDGAKDAKDQTGDAQKPDGPKNGNDSKGQQPKDEKTDDGQEMPKDGQGKVEKSDPKKPGDKNKDARTSGGDTSPTGDRQNPAVDDPNPDTSTTDADAKNRKKAGNLQLEDIRKKVTKDVLKKANMTEQEYQDFLKSYEAMLKRKQQPQGEDDKLTDPKATGGDLKNIGGKQIKPTGKDDKTQGNTIALPPPEFRDAYKEFTEKISQPNRPTEKR